MYTSYKHPTESKLDTREIFLFVICFITERRKPDFLVLKVTLTWRQTISYKGYKDGQVLVNDTTSVNDTHAGRRVSGFLRDHTKSCWPCSGHIEPYRPILPE
jgi:hypothetical protein